MIVFITALLPALGVQADTDFEASTTAPGAEGNGPEHIYVLHNAHTPAEYWKADLTPSNNKKDWGTFAFYQVEGKDNAFYIYDCSTRQWLTYEVKDSYGAQVKGNGQQAYVKLSDDKDVQSYFIVTSTKYSSISGYNIQLVNKAGTGASWYLNYYQGYDKNKDKTIGIWWHDGSKDAGSLWVPATPPSSKPIEVATSEPETAAESRLDNVFTMHNGYGGGVGTDMQPSTSSHGHFVFYKVEGVDNAYYIYDYSNGKWLTYDKRDSYNTAGAAMYGEKDFVKLSDEKANYFYITPCTKNGVEGYQIQPFDNKDEVAEVFLNYYTGSALNQEHTIGFYTHDGNRDAGSLWKLDHADPYAVTISDEGSQSQFDYQGDANVTLTRTFKAGCWNTLCVPFNVSAARLEASFGAGCKVREFTGVAADGTTLQFTATSRMEAGKPYLVNPASDVVSPVIANVTLLDREAQSVEHGSYRMVGTYVPATLNTDGSHLFLTATNHFVKPQDNQNKHNILKGLRAYFVMPVGTNSSALHLMLDGETTGIEAADVHEKAEPSPVYNLQGVCVGTSLNGLGSGVYVRNGKKYVVK